MLSAWLGSDKYQFCKPLVLLDWELNRIGCLCSSDSVTTSGATVAAVAIVSATVSVTCSLASQWAGTKGSIIEGFKTLISLVTTSSPQVTFDADTHALCPRAPVPILYPDPEGH